MGVCMTSSLNEFMTNKQWDICEQRAELTSGLWHCASSFLGGLGHQMTLKLVKAKPATTQVNSPARLRQNVWGPPIPAFGTHKHKNVNMNCLFIHESQLI